MKTEKQIREKIKELKSSSRTEFHIWNKAAIAALLWVIEGEMGSSELHGKIHEDTSLGN